MPTVLNEETISEMAKAGVVYGHKKSRTHPKMRPYIAGTRNEIEFIDPEATLNALQKATEFLKEKIKAGGLVLLVGTISAAKNAIEEFAHELKFPYVTTRWLGGTLTNFKVLNDRKTYYETLKTRREKGELVKYTKKEQLEFSKEIAKLSKNFDGLANLSRVPDALLVVDIDEHGTAIREARKMRIPIVALVDTDDDVSLVDYPIFANDHAKSSIEWVVGKIKEGIKDNSETLNPKS